LIDVGEAGTGFTQAMILQLNELLKPIPLSKMPLSKKARPEEQDRQRGRPEVLG
jgi:hypothetical protein